MNITATPPSAETSDRLRLSVNTAHTLLDDYAIAALNGVVSRPHDTSHPETLSKWAWDVAESMFDERMKRGIV